MFFFFEKSKNFINNNFQKRRVLKMNLQLKKSKKRTKVPENLNTSTTSKINNP